jgi:hypothetical protein
LIGVEAEPTGSFPVRSAEYTVVAAPAGQTFAAWAAGVFTPAQLADSNVSGPTADADGDGLSNFIEYAFNLDPNTPDRATPPTGERGIPRGALVAVPDPGAPSAEYYFEITMVRRQEPVDVTYALEHSSDLIHWSDALADPALLRVQELVPVGSPGMLERVTYRTVQPIEPSNPRYVRVLVEPKP